MSIYSNQNPESFPDNTSDVDDAIQEHQAALRAYELAIGRGEGTFQTLERLKAAEALLDSMGIPIGRSYGL